MDNKCYWTENKESVLCIMAWQEWKNVEGLEELTTEELEAHLNPPPPPVNMEDVNRTVQSLTDTTAHGAGYENMVDAYTWANTWGDQDAKDLQAWDKSIWGAVDSLNGVPPVDLNTWLEGLPKYA